MSRDKQIEEMAKDLGGTWVVDLEGNPHDLSEVLMQCDIETISEQLYEMNYRKASDVAREIFEEIEEIAKIYTFPIVKNGVVEIVKEPFWCIEPSDIAELKKKYLETDTNDGCKEGENDNDNT